MAQHTCPAIEVTHTLGVMQSFFGSRCLANPNWDLALHQPHLAIFVIDQSHLDLLLAQWYLDLDRPVSP